MRITKVYTRAGDKGQTSLVGGARVSKSDPRVEAFGDIDELNSVLGLVRSRLDDGQLDNILARIQNDLFIVGADLASPSEVEAPRVDESRVKMLESASDELVAELGPLTEFILPGGGEAGATLHLARTVARRAERRIVALASVQEVTPLVIAYVNRLSDLLFLMARAVNRRSGEPESLADFSKK